MEALISKIMDGQKKSESKKIAILAGHYCLAPALTELSHKGEAECFSFKLGVKLHKALTSKNKDARLVLWVNDIGINKEQREQIKSEFQLPHNYLAILISENVALEQVEVIFESASRNKASTLLRQKIKQSPESFQKYTSEDPALIRCIDMGSCSIETGKTVYAIPGPEGAPLVMKEGSNPKCNLILATLFSRIAQQNPDLLFINIFNDIYIDRIRLGIFVAREVFSLPQKFINLFCDDGSYFEENFFVEAEEFADVI